MASSMGWFHRILLPPIILQSVLIGGAYSTGREVAEYAGKYGSYGWISVVVIFLGFTLMSILCFELARLRRAYEYKSWIREIIGRLWPLFDLLVIVMLLLVIAVIVAAVGSVLKETLGLSEQFGIILAFVVVVTLNYCGEGVIERFKTFGTLVLYLGYLVFGCLVLSSVPEGVSAAASESVTDASAGAALGAGVLYVGYNLAVYPTVLFSLHRQESRRDTVLAGIVAGVLMTAPFALTFLCFLQFGFAARVIEARVPWLVMLDGLGGPWILVLFGLVVGWTLVETSVGSIHAVVDRLDKNIDDLPAPLARRIGGLSRWNRAGISMAILGASLILSRFGIIALVGQGYRYLAYGFIALFAVPLLTVGVYKIVRGPRS